MSCNINKMIDMYENTELNKRVLGIDYRIVDEKVCGNILHLTKKVYSSVKLKGAIYVYTDALFCDIEEFLSYAIIDNHDDWRLPTLAELDAILENACFKKSNSFLHTAFWSSEKADETGYPFVIEIIDKDRTISLPYRGDMWKFPFIIVR